MYEVPGLPSRGPLTIVFATATAPPARASQETESLLSNPINLPVAVRLIGGEEIATTNARELHAFLEVGRDFSNWIKEKIAEYGFIEDQEYAIEVFAKNGENSKGGRPSKEYFLTVDAAKQLCMVVNTPKGRAARLHYIACEKELRAIKTHQGGVLHELEVLMEAKREILAGRAQIEALTGENAALKPRAMYADLLADSKGDWVPMQFAKAASVATGIKPRKILNKLRDARVFYYLGKRLTPYQDYMDRDECRIIDELCADGKTRPQTVITPAGRQALFRLLTGDEQLALPGSAQ